ncbi:type II toxin-antitoxin system VapC family toxin [Brevundimonas sp. SL130]|uniref:type II toxin-antitoxin system VapC family toxin n=1 Tax=Brevundimonas sp. SL130 TaxID=2995143 RepID=UPI00226C71E1|nr:type II toxin-antitoxin system VapC family toxin [Brevundimonas sp. SL130]WAC59975.1 type II toxin-antitoxin system VapC family toxin [Brevundimonas sp. SL130]
MRLKAPLLLDTCAALWTSTSDMELRDQAAEALIQADAQGVPIHLSPITAWEVAQLVARGRYALSVDPLIWFETLLAAGLTEAPLSPDILVAASYLPQSKGLRDPADRILAATARLRGWTLVTRDRPLLAYAEGGHIRALAC